MIFPGSDYWWHLFSTLGWEIAALAALGLAAQYFMAAASWRRAVWQFALLAMLAVCVSEWTGAGRAAAEFLFERNSVQTESASSRAKIIVDSSFHVFVSAAPIQTRAVWWPGKIWLAGALLVLLRLIVAQALLLTLRLRRPKIAEPALLRQISAISRQLGLRRKVGTLRLAESMSPMAFGFFPPTLGIPEKFQEQFGEAEQEAILTHELAHLKACDPAWFLLTDIVTVLLWWHPLAWWARRRLHNEAELAADDSTLLLPGGPNALAACLVRFGRQMTGRAGWGFAGIDGAFRSMLGKRVERLTRLSGAAVRPLRPWLVVVGACGIPAVVMAFASFSSANAQQPSGRFLLAALVAAPAPPSQVPNRSTIAAALERIHLPVVSFDNLPLSKVLQQLRDQAGKFDSKGARLNFMMDNGLSKVTVNIESPLKDFSLDMVLDALTKTASAPIYYSVEDHAVVFHAGTPPGSYQGNEVLYTRVFKVDSRRFLKALQSVSAHSVHAASATIPPADWDKMLRNYFAAAGINLDDPGKVMFFNDRLGELLVRASPADLEIMENAVGLLNAAPPQVRIESRFYEMSPKQADALKIPGGSPAILSPKMLDTFLEKIKKAGLTVLAAPSLILPSGSNARVDISSTEDMENMDISATVTPSETAIELGVNPLIKRGSAVWQTKSTATIADGYTMAIESGDSSVLPGEVEIVFITARIIDETGVPVHPIP